MVRSFASSRLTGSKAAHWNGVHGFGTNELIDSVSRPNGSPRGDGARSRARRRAARSGMASMSSSVSVGSPIMK